MASHELFTHYLLQKTAGAYHFHSVLDEAECIGGFYQSQRTGFVVL